MSREWNSSVVMTEFAKIAAESNLEKNALLGVSFEPKNREQYVGNSKTPTPVKDHRRYEPTEDYGVTKDEGYELIEKAHPESPAQVADAMGDGALVENQMEQQKKNIDIANNMPKATLPGLHADVIHSLIKLANELDEMGKHEEAKYIDKTLSESLKIPFEKGHLRREAAWFIPALIAMVAPFVVNKFFGTKGQPMKWKGSTAGKVGWISAIVGGLVNFGDKIISLQEDLKTDIKEFYGALVRAKSSKVAQSIAKKIRPFLNSFDNIDLTKKAGVAEYTKNLSSLKSVLPSLKRDIAVLKQELNPKRYDILKTPLKKMRIYEPEFIDLEARYKDFTTSFDDAYKGLNSLYHVGKQADIKAKSLPFGGPTIGMGLKGIQTVLSTVGFKGTKWTNVKPTGNIYEETKSAASELESLIDKSLRPVLKGSKYEKTSMKGKILSSSDPQYPQKLYRLIKEIEFRGL